MIANANANTRHLQFANARRRCVKTYFVLIRPAVSFVLWRSSNRLHCVTVRKCRQVNLASHAESK
jgi:hypothetical protein